MEEEEEEEDEKKERENKKREKSKFVFLWILKESQLAEKIGSGQNMHPGQT